MAAFTSLLSPMGREIIFPQRLERKYNLVRPLVMEPAINRLEFVSGMIAPTREEP
jgi:hypothetical protein